ncbi:exodeoxyribonuclease VII small subunit [Lapidilactobacillus luobeiensis]|uniref:exodeoxyribonuclease VII small subunit n=1 Tax=Lapidilactobacillus luobeiensis TaxID=2950371 RepID=UPI0021C2E328|nr:exodeoxyribonuclease VII small subunit [Lapidilactobacillus luobeiensis]
MSEPKKSFEAQLDELSQIVNELEQGNVPLETALAKFQTGIALSRSLEQTLAQAEQTLTKVVDEQGNVSDLADDDNQQAK